MDTGNTQDIEAKIRESEEKLGIRPGDGVVITYERQSQNVAFVLYAAFIIGIFALFMRGMGRVSMKMSNPFSSMTKANFTLIDPQIK